MARRRMISLDVVDTDSFLEMPQSTQNLYFHLAIRGDDDGFIANPKKIMKAIGAGDDDLKILLVKQFIIAFKTGICVVRHWKIHNYIQNDRYKPSIYYEEKRQLLLGEDNVYSVDTSCIQNGYNLDTQIRTSKDNIDKKSINIDTEDFKNDDSFIEPEMSEINSLFRTKHNFSNIKKVSKSVEILEDEKYLILSNLLYTEHLKHDDKFLLNKNHKVIFNKWAKDIRLLIEIDKREYELVKEIIIWCQSQGNFWIGNILSGGKLRKQFATLLIQYNQDKNKKPKKQIVNAVEIFKQLEQEKELNKEVF
jgi:hypothetical protein